MYNTTVVMINSRALPAAGEDGTDELQNLIVTFIRSFGLLRPDQTPCGVAVPISDAHAITELQHSAPMTQFELSARLRLEKSTVSRLLKRLEEQHWVGRERDPQDTRRVLVRLTPAGEEMACQIAQARHMKVSEIAARLRIADRQALARGMGALIRAIDEIAPQERHDDNHGSTR